MSTLVALGILAGLLAYIIDAIMNPEKHIVGLIILAIIYAIFGAFFDTTGAKDDYSRKKRG